MKTESAKTAAAAAAMLLLLALGAAACAFFGGSETADEAGVAMELPGYLPPWRGTTYWFCQAEGCGKGFLDNGFGFSTPCPACGGELRQMNLPERRLLPADTEIVRKFYDTPQHLLPLNVSIVLSGADRSSIHRPEVCQTAAGYEIVRRRRIGVPLSWRPDRPLEITVLEMTRHGNTELGQPPQHTFYAYWFVGAGGRETASHWKRFWWMGTDRVFRGVSHRWAYVAVVGPRVPGEDNYLGLLSAFASQLHRKVLLPPATDAAAPAAE